jgi:tripeptidyl-peptidase-1
VGVNWWYISLTPIMGSIITLINEQRIKAGKSPVGFINPVLYANPWALSDIIEGGNPGCGTNGFDAVDGWDPVAGLRTPNFEKLLEVWMALPLVLRDSPGESDEG